MTKDILAISLAGVEIERVFNLKQNICNYQQNHLHEETIRKIMIVKHAHQKKMIDEILLSETELKKKAVNDDKSFYEAEKNHHILSEEKKLTQSCHFDYHETAQAVAKKAAMEAAKKAVKETDQRRLKMSA